MTTATKTRPDAVTSVPGPPASPAARMRAATEGLPPYYVGEPGLSTPVAGLGVIFVSAGIRVELYALGPHAEAVRRAVPELLGRHAARLAGHLWRDEVHFSYPRIIHWGGGEDLHVWSTIDSGEPAGTLILTPAEVARIPELPPASTRDEPPLMDPAAARRWVGRTVHHWAGGDTPLAGLVVVADQVGERGSPVDLLIFDRDGGSRVLRRVPRSDCPVAGHWTPINGDQP